MNRIYKIEHVRRANKSYSHYRSLERGWTGKACCLAHFGLKDAGFDTLLVTGKVPEGEEDMGYFAAEMGVIPRYFSEMSREISLNDAVTVWKLYRLFLRERPDIVHTHTAKA